MNYLTLFEGQTPFNKLRLLLGLRAQLDSRLTKYVLNILSGRDSPDFKLKIFHDNLIEFPISILSKLIQIL